MDLAQKLFVFTWRYILAVHLLSFVILGLLWAKLPPQIPLWYNLSWGTSQLGTPMQAVIVLSVSLVLVISCTFGIKFTNIDTTLKVLSYGSILVCCGIINLGLWRIIFAVV